MDLPLLILKRQGLINDYFVADPTLFNVPEDKPFDVIWLQRVRYAALITHLEERLSSQYLYDIDDFMIGRPLYISPSELHKTTVIKALKSCKILTTPSTRLTSMLETGTGEKLMTKTVVCPNAFCFPQGVRSPRKPQGVLLTNSDALPLFANLAPFVTAVRQFVQRHDLPVYHIGTPFRGLESWGYRVISLGRIPFWHYHFLLASMPCVIGLAPLETTGDKDTLDFINGKSDIKMVTYGGLGHPSLYSDAPPYTDTEIKAGLIVKNTFDSWTEGLEIVYNDGWRKSEVDQRDVISKRHIDAIARQNWYDALERARLKKPITGRNIKYSNGRMHYYLGALRHIVLSQDHAFRRDLQKNIPDFARRILRRFLINI